MLLPNEDKKQDRLIAAQLNEIYGPLEMKAMQILFGMQHRIFDPRLCYYSGHYTKTEDGNYQRNCYPIPVIEVQGYCDIEINLDHSITVTAKQKRENALACSYEKIKKYEFEAYGVEDYLQNLCHPGMTISELQENIKKSREKEIGFSFCFGFDTDGDAMYEFVKLLRREGFYY